MRLNSFAIFSFTRQNTPSPEKERGFCFKTQSIFHQVIFIANDRVSSDIRGGYASSDQESKQHHDGWVLPNNPVLLHIVRPSIAIPVRSKWLRHADEGHVHEHGYLMEIQFAL
jgi:hypothetical protein